MVHVRFAMPAVYTTLSWKGNEIRSTRTFVPSPPKNRYAYNINPAYTTLFDAQKHPLRMLSEIMITTKRYCLCYDTPFSKDRFFPHAIYLFEYAIYTT